ncbi:MAG: radical SAM protein [Thermodesulfobacteriota bacterium]
MDALTTILSRCRLCGHGCGADRAAGETGPCRAGAALKVAAHLPHHGEEPPLSGVRGSGTIFFSHCPLACVFCQNHQISQGGLGREVSVADLADMMFELEARGVHNINLVSPTPWAAHIAAALEIARRRGLALPVVYNTGGFDSPAALGLMDGLVDVYLPDVKYRGEGRTGRDSPDRLAAARLFGARNYEAVNRAAVVEMYWQVGSLVTGGGGLARRGVLVRHLVLPEDLAGTGRVLAWLAERFGREVWLSLMAQYLPRHRVLAEPEVFPGLARPLTETEYETALDQALDLGLENVFVQDLEAPETYVPDFTTADVFNRKE